MRTKVKVSFLIAGMLLLPILGGVTVYYDWWGAITRGFYAADGRIIVNSPSVYTRQRLVNDRLSQSAWLKDQLNVTTNALLTFQPIDSVRHDSDERTSDTKAVISVKTAKGAGSEANGGESPVTEGASSNNGPNSANSDAKGTAHPDSYHVEPTTADLFRAMNTYREEVRSEMMQTLLDDRHDILGNTIYRLAIDATVLAGRKSDKLALISVILNYNPDDHRPDYDVLYSDWIRYIQRIVNNSVDSLAKNFSVPAVDTRVRVTLPYFIADALCKVIEAAANASTADIERRCNVWSTEPTPSLDLTWRILTSYVTQYLAHRDRIVRDRFEGNLQSIPLSEKESPLKLNPADFPYAYDFTSRECNRERTEGRRTSDINGVHGQVYTVKCPLFTFPDEGLVAGITLYDYVVAHGSSLADLIADPQFGGDPKALAGKLLTDSVAPSCSEQHKTACIVPDLTQSQFGCVAAEYLVWSLNGLGDPEAPKDQRIGTFLDLRLVGRQLKKCTLMINPSPGGTAPPILIERLNRFSEVYAYSVTPKSLSQRVSSTVDIRDELQLLLSAKTGIATGDAATISNQFRKHAEELQTVQQHAVVVGFARSRGARGADHPYETNFGWAIAPHLGANGEQEQVDGQYGLAAVISVPGWWRSINLKIKTCWTRRQDLQIPLDKAEDVCLGGTVQEQEDIVRLPGVVSDISRKLGFEVVQEPYLSQDQIPQILEVGRPGDILLKGDRLWRSTDVTLGSQPASRINVLPDMEGIVAHFNCIHAQFGLGKDYSGPPIPVPVIVWTSEGRAQPDDENTVRLMVRPEFSLCPEERAKPAAEWDSGGGKARNTEEQKLSVEQESAVQKINMAEPQRPPLPAGALSGQAVSQRSAVSFGPAQQPARKRAEGSAGAR